MDEGFFFNSPHISDGLFSYRKGWFVYTPIMVFAVLGLFTMKKAAAAYRLPLILTLLVLIYVIFSWWCWWYGGSFGSRVMIDYYGLLALPLATFFQHTIYRSCWVKAMVSLLAVFFIFLNFFQMNQYTRSLLHYDSMSKDLYWSIFLTKNRPADYQDNMDIPDYTKALNGENESE
jgi:hypothetical protein